MSYKVGKYIILRHTYWTHPKATTLTILEIDEQSEDVIYFYDDEQVRRCRNFDDFERIELIPHSPLLEELI